MKNDDKLRLLYICKIFFEKTDEEHFISVAQIIDILENEYRISAYRMTVVSDIDILIRFGMDIQKIRSRQNLYHLASRTFDLPEPKILIDAVISSKFITAKKSMELISGIMKLSGEEKAASLKRNLYIDENYKAENEKCYLIADAINEAINKGKKISFQTAEYNIRKERILHNQGEKYVFSPYALIWDGDYYYMVGYSEKHEAIGSHRVDRIWERPEILGENAHPMPNGINISDYTHSMFRMYSTVREKVDLICQKDLMNTMIDRFGRNVDVFEVDDEHFGVSVIVAINHVFFSWLFGFDGKVIIRGPENVKNDYRKMVDKAYSMTETSKNAK